MRRRWRRCWHRRRADAAALSIILLFFALFFVRALVAGRFLIVADAYYQSYPLRTVAWQMIRQGVLPVWTPHLLAGYPLLSMGQLSLGYPLTWGYLFLPGRWAEQLYVLAPFFLSPIFTYFYARETGRSRLAALCAGLAYAYGGGMTSKLSVVGFHTNALMWLPLVLIPLERARTRSFIPCLVGAGLAYALCVLNGYGQGFLYVGSVAAAYAAFLSLTDARAARRGDTKRTLLWPSFRPLVVALLSIVLGAGVGAFQILETMRAARRSIRSTLAYDVFSAGSFTPANVIRSFVAPLYHYIEVSAYVAPLVAGLAVYGVVRAWRRGGDARVWFWLATVCVMALAMTGPATPLNRLLYHVPVYNRFRYPSRHAFEWSFALSILAAYGWDALRLTRTRLRTAQTRARLRAVMLAVCALLVCALVGVLWWRATETPPPQLAAPDTGQGTGLAETTYILWKIIFTLLVCVALWLSTRVMTLRTRARLFVCVIMLACFVEPFLLTARWWLPDAKPTSRFTADAPVTRYLQQFPPEQGRIYTRVNVYLVGYPPQPPPVDLPNLTALAGLHNVAGYEQLVLERFSRALGNAGPDAVNTRYDVTGGPDPTLFSTRSHVLDILNTAHVVTYANLATAPTALVWRDDVPFAAQDFGRELRPGETLTLTGIGAHGDTLALVTSLANSIDVTDGQTVATLRIYTTDGRVSERDLRAGMDTSEWAHERADVRAAMKHRLASVFDTRAGDAANSFPAQRYSARVALGAQLNLARLEITNVATHASLAVWKATIYDAAQAEHGTLLTTDAQPLDATRWTPVFNESGVLALRNARALPRAWLVTAAEATDGEAALHLIRGESPNDFDPRHTALLEVRANELPHLPGGALASGSSARIVAYEPSRLQITTDAPTPTVLVVSEIFYPGWEATIDGARAPILLTDYLLRGVALPAGQHTVEMRYTAPAARVGAIISVATLLLLCVLAIIARRKQER
jgi:hypothetical protein